MYVTDSISTVTTDWQVKTECYFLIVKKKSLCKMKTVPIAMYL